MPLRDAISSRTFGRRAPSRWTCSSILGVDTGAYDDGGCVVDMLAPFQARRRSGLSSRHKPEPSGSSRLVSP